MLNNCFAWIFHHLTCLNILEGDITSITNYDYYKYFSISAWGISGGSCDAKEKDKYQKKKGINIE